MSQIVTVTDVIMWRSKWDSGIWRPESSRMAEEWGVSSGGKRKRRWNDLRADGIILSSVAPLAPALFFSTGFIIHPSALQLHVFVFCPPRLWCVRCLTNLINCVWPTAQIFVENTLWWVFIAVPLYHPAATTKQECRNEITEKSNGQYLWPQRGNNYSIEYIVPIQGCVAFNLKMWQSRDMIDCTDSP